MATKDGVARTNNEPWQEAGNLVVGLKYMLLKFDNL